MQQAQVSGRQIVVVGLNPELSKPLPFILGLREEDKVLFPKWFEVSPNKFATPPDIFVIATKHGENPAQLRLRVSDTRLTYRGAKVVLVAANSKYAAESGADRVVSEVTAESVAAAIQTLLDNKSTN